MSTNDMDNEVVDSDYFFKVVLVGDRAVGKVSLMLRFAHNGFRERSGCTVGVEFAKRLVRVDNKSVMTQMWSLAGRQSYRLPLSLFYRLSTAVIIVYDVTRRRTFEAIEEHLKEVRHYLGDQVVIGLVGNKIDASDCRTVSMEEAEKFARANALPFFVEVSALDGTNVSDAFDKLLLACILMKTHVETRIQPWIDQNGSGEEVTKRMQSRSKNHEMNSCSLM